MSNWEFPAPDPPESYLEHVRELESEAHMRVKNQHVVSKVVLKGFATPGANGKGWQLTPFDLRFGRELKPRGLSGCARVPDFLKFASASAEQLWSNVETPLHAAISAAVAGQLHDQDAHADAIKDGIALHLVRSLRYMAVHQAAVEQSIEDVRLEAVNSRRELLQAEFHRRYGLLAAGPEALGMLLDEPISKWRSLNVRGATARVSMQDMFRRVRAVLKPQEIEVWHVPIGSELLISDSPAFTFKYLNGNTALMPNVAIGDSNGIALPIAQNCLVAIGPIAKDDELSSAQASLFNQLQVTIGHRYVYYRPGSGLKAFVQETLRPQSSRTPATNGTELDFDV